MAGRTSRKRTAPARLREGKFEVRKFVCTKQIVRCEHMLRPLHKKSSFLVMSTGAATNNENLLRLNLRSVLQHHRNCCTCLCLIDPQPPTKQQQHTLHFQLNENNLRFFKEHKFSQRQ